MIKKQTQIEIVVGIIILILIGSFGLFRYFNAFETSQTAANKLINSKLLSQQKQLEQAQLEIKILVDENESVASKIEEETRKRLFAENERRIEALLSQQKIIELEQSLSNSKQPNLSYMIQQWRPRISLITCTWTIFPGFPAQGSGSGVLFSNQGNLEIITNRHVLIYNGYGPTSCTITFPDSNKNLTISAEDIEIASSGADWGIIKLKNPNQYLKNIATPLSSMCNVDAKIGDQIIILGYPSIGSRTDITATEGIISGYENNFFITSAKVERGNSGGAAILANSNCYLGIPTFVGAGQLESLARILDRELIIR